MNKEFVALITQVGLEKGVSTEIVLDSLRSALAAAYQRSYEAEDQDIRAELDPKSGGIRILRARTVVEGEPEDATQISLDEAKRLQQELPRVKVRRFADNGHTLLLEGVDLVGNIRTADFYRRSRKDEDPVRGFIPPTEQEQRKAREGIIE